MCDLDTYRARIGLFRGVTLKKIVCSGENGQVRKGTTHDTGVSSIDMLSTFIFWWLGMLLCASVIDNVQNATLHEMSTLNEKTERKGTIVCCQHMWDRTDSATSSTACLFAMHVPAIELSFAVVNLFFAVWRLRLSGDVEENPGPDPAPSQLNSGNGANESENDTRMSAMMEEFFSKMTNRIQQQMNDQTSVIRNELSGMRKELSDIRLQCEQINNRCDRMEKDQQELSENVAVLSADISAMYEEVTEGREETQTVKNNIQELKGEVQALNSEIDRLEGFSRRDNLRFFGIAPNSDQENGDMCVATLVNTLNSVDSSHRWTEEDIVRAHRIGQARYGKPRPMIARFTRWKDKMNIITNKDFKEKLKQHGVGVANDLTRRQANIVAQAKREGRRAFFRKGEMVVGPPLADSRTFAQVVSTHGDNTVGVAANDRGNTGDELPTRQHALGRGRVHQHGESPGDSTLTRNTRPQSGAVNSTTDDRSASVREARAERDQHLDTRAGREGQPADCASVGGRENLLLDAGGPSLIGQPGQGEGRDEVVSSQRDVTGQMSGARVGQPPRDSERGPGVSTHRDVVRRDVASHSTDAGGARRSSAGRQTGLRGYLGNHGGSVRSDRSLRNKKAK